MHHVVAPRRTREAPEARGPKTGEANLRHPDTPWTVDEMVGDLWHLMGQRGANSRVATFAGGLGGSATVAFSFLYLAFRALPGALVRSRRGLTSRTSNC
jgi:hypothetical protein